MSLIDSAMEKTYIMDKVTEPDGRGGVIVRYIPSTEIMVAYSFDTSTEARVAERDGTSDRYTITTRKNINLQYHDVIKRQRDNKIFRITSDGDDNYTPVSSSLNMRQVEAEEWSLPNGQTTGVL